MGDCIWVLAAEPNRSYLIAAAYRQALTHVTFDRVVALLSLLCTVAALLIAVKSKLRPRGLYWAMSFFVLALFSSWVVLSGFRYEIRGTHERHYQANAQAMGIALDNRTDQVVMNRAGGGKLRRNLEVRASGLDPKQSVDCFELKVQITDPAESNPTVWSCDSVLKECDNRPHKGANPYTLCYRASGTQKPGTTFVSAINISPPLVPQTGDAVAGTGVSTSSTGLLREPFEIVFDDGSFAMTEGKARANSKRHNRDLLPEWEFYMFEVRYPTNKVTIVVTFPEGFQEQKLRGMVFYGQNRLEHGPETAYIATRAVPGRDSDGRRTATLEVEYPVLGLFYAVGWIPPKVWE